MMRFLVVFLLVAMPSACFSWSAAGHEAGGVIAYFYLKSTKPETVDKLVSILEKHPWYETEWQSRLSGKEGEQKALTLFMLASIFPDEARKSPLGNGDKTKWHYINYPLNPKNLPVPEMPVPNGEQILTELLTNINSQTGQQQALDLCWIFHIMQDLHQPLHTTALFDDLHKTGDKGGNDTYFTLENSEKPIRLHSFWDGLIKGQFDSIPQFGKTIMALPKYSPDSLVELKMNKSIHDWVVNESYQLAITKVYRDGTLNGPQDSATPVPLDYEKEAFAIAERRVVLSGYRLGMALREIFGDKM
ncbi:MAG TPA: S1/P1 nuclease [Catalimonadaceae bacterium]|nr:S1/P1 nuclease [Catalimonadaceae bacterium]